MEQFRHARESRDSPWIGKYSEDEISWFKPMAHLGILYPSMRTRVLSTHVQMWRGTGAMQNSELLNWFEAQINKAEKEGEVACLGNW